MKPVLDHAKLQGLKDILGEQKSNAALERFQEELHTCLSAIESSDPEQAESAHRLAGVAGLLGFDDLEEHSRRFLAAVTQEQDQIATLAEALLAAANRAEAEIAALR